MGRPTTTRSPRPTRWEPARDRTRSRRRRRCPRRRRQPPPQPWRRRRRLRRRGTPLPRATGSGTYGADGYALLGWESGGDLVSIPSASLVLDQGSRYRWNTNTTNVRAVENPAQTQRRATQWFHATSLRLHLTFNTAYAGVLHLYALDWDGTARRGIVYVDDGSSVRSVNLNASFNAGAWMHFPITVSRGRHGKRSRRSDRRQCDALRSVPGRRHDARHPRRRRRQRRCRRPLPTPVTPRRLRSPHPVPTPVPTPAPTPVVTPVPTPSAAAVGSRAAR